MQNIFHKEERYFACSAGYFVFGLNNRLRGGEFL